MIKNEMLELFNQNIKAIFYFKQPLADTIYQIQELMSRAYDIGFTAGASSTLTSVTDQLTDAMKVMYPTKLIWKDCGGLNESIAITDSPVGRYYIGKDNRMPDYGVFWHNEADEERFRCECKSIDEGKEIAQKNWEKRRRPLDIK